MSQWGFFILFEEVLQTKFSGNQNYSTNYMTRMCHFRVMEVGQSVVNIGSLEVITSMKTAHVALLHIDVAYFHSL